MTLVLATQEVAIFEVGGVVAGIDDEPWRYFTTPFVHDSLAYQFVTLVTVGVFGSLLERRFGWFSVIAMFLGRRRRRRGGGGGRGPHAAVRGRLDLPRAGRQRRPRSGCSAPGTWRTAARAAAAATCSAST